MRRIDPISFVATQLGTREVPNLGGIDDADDMTSLVQRARDAETIAPGGFQTGVNPSHPLGDQPIEEMAPSIRGVRKAPCAHLVAARHARVQRVFGNVDTNTPSITVLSFHLVSSARAPLRTTLYTGSTLTRVPRYRPICTAELGKRGLIYRTGSFAKGTQEAHRSPRSSAKCVYPPSNLQRTRDEDYSPPPARIRTCSFPAYGSYLRCLTAKRWSGQGWRIRGFGSQSSISRFIAAQVRPALWLRRESALRHPRVISSRNALSARKFGGTA